MSIWKRRLVQSVRLVTVTIAIATLLLLSPAGKLFDDGLTAHFRAMNERRLAHRLSWLDGIEIKLLYNTIATAGHVISPEAAQIVAHYLNGGGKPLWLDASYLKTSPVVLKCLKTLKPGQSRQFAVKFQREDSRLTYAFNPFSLRRERHSVLLFQYIEFKNDRETFTKLSYFPGRGFLLPDGLIRATRPTPFWAYAKWSI
ncbi:hypothetical protein [Hymenobacter actinosclerus]|uniref:Uncharacterized protein n=1 Tax=Hymenobacter actinosclerus TaxID=82805 RepID=A0A1I0IR56_9BACT|nr:hypothetical protein [Hymenobacter actinosclerus]SET99674.1 hypothetical protein SAMN04487998_3460 [Hymenobacter actinosclerus]